MELLCDDVLRLILLKLTFKENHYIKYTCKRLKYLYDDNFYRKIYRHRYGNINNDHYLFEKYIYQLKKRKNTFKTREDIFYWSIQNGYDKLLIRTIKKIDINTHIKKGLSKETNYVEIFRILLQYSTDNIENLLLTCKNSAIIRNILKTIKVDNDLLLYYAVILNNIQLTKILLENGALPKPSLIRFSEHSDKISKELLKYMDKIPDNILFSAIKSSSYKTVKFILKHDINRIKNNNLLDLAVYRKDNVMIKILLENGCLMSDNGLKYLLNKNNPDGALLLCKYGANYDDKHLYIACKKNYLEVVKCLIENGVKITSSCFIVACINNNVKIVKYLIKNGADVNCKNESNKSAIIISYDYGNSSIVKILKEAGAKLYFFEKIKNMIPIVF